MVTTRAAGATSSILSLARELQSAGCMEEVLRRASTVSSRKFLMSGLTWAVGFLRVKVDEDKVVGY